MKLHKKSKGFIKSLSKIITQISTLLFHKVSINLILEPLTQKSEQKDKYESFYAEEDVTYFEKLNFSEKIQLLPSE